MTTPTDGESEPTNVGLFEDLAEPSVAQLHDAQAHAASKRSQGAPRVLEANRAQVELRASDLESLLAEEHRARLVWGYVERQDLGALFDAIKARGAAPGRRAIDPRILFALWLYAVLDGVGSGREVARLSREHDAYRWICGGVPINYHALNDFRSGGGIGNDKALDEVLSDNVAALAAVGAITLERVAQDGMRVRADIGEKEHVVVSLVDVAQQREENFKGFRCGMTGLGVGLDDAPGHETIKLGDESVGPAGLLAAVARIDIEGFVELATHAFRVKPLNLFKQGDGDRLRFRTGLQLNQPAQKQRQGCGRHHLGGPLSDDQQLATPQLSERAAQCGQVHRVGLPQRKRLSCLGKHLASGHGVGGPPMRYRRCSPASQRVGDELCSLQMSAARRSQVRGSGRLHHGGMQRPKHWILAMHGSRRHLEGRVRPRQFDDLLEVELRVERQACQRERRRVLGLSDGEFTRQKPVQPLRGAVDHRDDRTVVPDGDLRDQCRPRLGPRINVRQFRKMAPQDVADDRWFPGARHQNRLLTSSTLPFGKVFLATRRRLASSRAVSGPASCS